MNRIPEITAPAGSRESLAAALSAGADAVYAGIRGLNMRRAAEAFGPGDIRTLVSLTHDKGARFYLTLNIIMYDSDSGPIRHALDNATKSGVDGIICWDPMVILAARERGLPVHLSTQASVSNTRAASFYESLGVSRIVLARELSLEMIATVIGNFRNSGSALSFECFIHGAMCIAVSGRCLTSLLHHGRSANRGDCLQPCRRSYRITDKNGDMILNGHNVMNANDLCTIDILDRIMATGVDALKIEGRMRDARYVRTTVECYRTARDAILDGTYDASLINTLRSRLDRVFHRGFSHGFYESRPDNDISDIDGNSSPVAKLYAGRIVNYYRKAGAADIHLEAHGLTTGQTVFITGPTTGAVEFTVSSLRSENNKSINKAETGDLIGCAVPQKVRSGDFVFILEDAR